MENPKNAMVRRIMATMLAVLGCGGQRVEAAGPSKPYQLEIAPPEYGAVGQKQVVRVAVTPAWDWKINTKFPAELKVEAPLAVQVFQPIQKSGDAAVLRDDHLEFHLVAMPRKVGEYVLALVLKFGLCKKSECIWRTEKSTLRLRAR